MSLLLKTAAIILITTVLLQFAWSNSQHHGISHNNNHDLHGLDQTAEQLQNFTSQAQTVDQWLFSEDLFPGHIIPQNLHHSEAIKMFNILLEDNDLFSQAYERYRTQHDKQSDDVKLETRRTNFRTNLHFIFQHNLKADAGHYRFQVGVNQFADMNKEEMTHFLGGNNRIPIHPRNQTFTDPHAPPHFYAPSILPPSGTPFPLSFHLGESTNVSSVKNQKKCGSCVFFSYAGLLELLHAVKNDGEVVNLSEQMMLDCANKEHGYENNWGCDGNIMEDTGQFLIDHGVTHEEHYKYTAKQENCSKEGKDIIAQLKDHWQVDPTVEAFKHTLVNLQSPIAAAFYVYRQFMFYRAGVYDWCMPPNSAIGGHAVLIVGYGQFFDNGYWTVKNSWGKTWGEMGYFKYIAGSNQCNFERWGFTGSLV